MAKVTRPLLIERHLSFVRCLQQRFGTDWRLYPEST